MAMHEIKTYENKLSSKENWPFLGRYLQKKTLAFEDILPDIAKEAGVSDTVARAILDGTIDAVIALQREGFVRINLPGGFVSVPKILGSFPASNSPWNGESNQLILAWEIGDGLRNALVNVTPRIVTDRTIAHAVIHHVIDSVERRPEGIVYGKRPFRVQGFRIFINPEGGGVYLENAQGAQFPCTVDDAGDGQLATVHTTDLLPANDYWLVIETDAGEEGGIIQRPRKPVKYLHVEPEREITKIVAGPTGTPDDVIKSAYWIDLYGHGLEVAADGDVTADATYLGEPVHYTWKLAKVRTNTPEHLNLDYMSIDGTTNFIADNNTEVTFTVNGVSHTAIFNPS